MTVSFLLLLALSAAHFRKLELQFIEKGLEIVSHSITPFFLLTLLQRSCSQSLTAEHDRQSGLESM